MSVPAWSWASARSIGTSHLRAGKGCDDFGACIEVTGLSNSALIAVASDGAGSASFSAIGAWITSRVFVSRAVHFIKSGEQVGDLTISTIKEWLDGIRDHIGSAARRRDATPRDFAATLVGVLAGSTQTAFIHVGDGGSVFRTFSEPRIGKLVLGQSKENTLRRPFLLRMTLNLIAAFS